MVWDTWTTTDIKPKSLKLKPIRKTSVCPPGSHGCGVDMRLCWKNAELNGDLKPDLLRCPWEEQGPIDAGCLVGTQCQTGSFCQSDVCSPEVAARFPITSCQALQRSRRWFAAGDKVWITVENCDGWYWTATMVIVHNPWITSYNNGQSRDSFHDPDGYTG